jgi:hypothetical protein
VDDFGVVLPPLMPICGVVFGIMAWKRGEQPSALYLAGSILNLATIFFILLRLLNAGSFG